MIDALFTTLLFAAFLGTMKLCYDAWEPKPYPKVHMRDYKGRVRR